MKAINEIIISSSNAGLTRLTIAGSMTFFKRLPMPVVR